MPGGVLNGRPKHPRLEAVECIFLQRLVFPIVDVFWKCVRLYDEWQPPRKLGKRSQSLRRELAREAPRPLRTKRRRALSSSETHANTTVDCPLLSRLPKEIRIQIWQYVLGSGGCHYHLIHGGGRTTHALCQFSNHENVNRLSSPCCSSCASRTCCGTPLMSHIGIGSESCIRQKTNVELVRNHWPRASSTLLRTCRQIYQDASLLLYSTNIFDVDDLSTFIYWSQTILPSRLAAVRALSLSWDILEPPLTKTDPSAGYQFSSPGAQRFLALRNSDQIWLHFWDIIATKMSSLQDLRMRIGFMPPFYGFTGSSMSSDAERGLRRDVNAQWVNPLLSIRGLKTFELEILSGATRYVYDPLGASGSEDDFELHQKTRLFLENLRRILCEP